MINKTVKELFQIATDNSDLNIENKKAAIDELKNRNLNIDDKSRIECRIELDTLFEEQRLQPDSIDVTISLISGVIILVVLLIILLKETTKFGVVLACIGFILILIQSIYNLFRLKNKKKMESARIKKINELLEKL